MKKLLLFLIILSTYSEVESPFWGQASKDLNIGSRVVGINLVFQKKNSTNLQNLEFGISYEDPQNGTKLGYSLNYNNFVKEVDIWNPKIIYFGGKDSFMVNILNTKLDNLEMKVCPVSHNGVVRDESLWLSSQDYNLKAIGIGIHGQTTFSLTTGSGYGTNMLKHNVILNTKKVEVSSDLAEAKYPVAVVKANKFYNEFPVTDENNNLLSYEILGETLNSIGIKNRYQIADEFEILQTNEPESTFNFNSNVYTFLEGKCWKIRKVVKKNHLRSDLKEIKIPEEVLN